MTATTNHDGARARASAASCPAFGHLATAVRAVAAAAVAGGLVACGGSTANQLVPTRNIDSASGTPQVTRVVDMGDTSLPVTPEAGTLPPPDSDGVFAIGELTLIEGRQFGKQPAVKIGGLPAPVLVRTGSGAIVVRIPAGAPSGEVEVQVSHPGGRGTLAIAIVRYAFAVSPGAGSVYMMTADARGALTPAGSLAVEGARAVAVSPTGQVALVAVQSGGAARLAVIATAASGGPRVVQTRDLGMAEASHVTVARDAPWAAVIGGGEVALVDLEDARRPALHAPTKPLADAPDAGGKRAIAAAALSHDGKLLVALYADGNAVVPVDVSRPMYPRPGAPVSVLPGERLPLARGVAFSPGGDRLWIVAGDDAASLKAGAHPTRLVAVQVPAMTVEAPVVVTGPVAPLGLAVARRAEVIGGGAIGADGNGGPIVIASVDRAVLPLLAAGGAGMSERLAQPVAQGKQPATIGQIQLARADGDASVVYEAPALMTDVALSHDARRWVAATIAAAGVRGGLAFGVTVAGLAGDAPVFVPLGDARAENANVRASIALSP